jgi:His/Glu/Gln/Arg/opine family amino acid ABC transporter permease subunit
MSGLPIDLALAWRSLPAMFGGLATTIALVLIVLVTGLLLAIPVSVARMSRNPIANIPAAAFVVFFRGAPLLILLYFVYYGFGQVEAIRNGPLWLVFGNAFACAVIGLTFNHAAFMVEVIRGSLQAVPAGLVEAASALGLTPRETLVHISGPLAIRYGLKAYLNEIIMFIKGTAVVGVITVTDLTAVANGLFEETYDPFTPMLTAAFFYWALVNVIRIAFERVDRRLARHLVRTGPVAEPTSVAPAGRTVHSSPAPAPTISTTAPAAQLQKEQVP